MHGRPKAPQPPREVPIDRRPAMRADDARRARRGALELLATLVVVAALIALLVWFLFYAHNPLLHP